MRSRCIDLEAVALERRSPVKKYLLATTREGIGIREHPSRCPSYVRQV